MSVQIEKVRNYVTGEVVEQVYAGTDTITSGTTTAEEVVARTVPKGYEGVIVSMAVTRNTSINVYIFINGKVPPDYADGWNAGGLAGLDYETPLLIPLEEGDKWSLKFTNPGASDVDVSWRIRIRLFKK